ncbi:putative membrane protein [Microbacterium sp. SORGH_AS 505]|uniref:pilus assembly protein TadG-related protein n=1 Tax=Microbacterium sp. SORGH_AS_0505 TaxID=3041770 RepID=UPI00278BABCB|nr:pilus assembly protein TadG-related protein [Microbacterium sp. SORGH_AS_0505]MDQ1127538.1 putative membrane protein [Microbacterium sp. SORGH_AS_0505]
MIRRDDQEGSILLLTIGYALLALVLMFVTVDATSLYLAQKRTQATADAAALAGADGFTLDVVDGEPRAELTDGGVREQAQAIVATEPDASIVSASSPDGVSARVVVSSMWRPPISTLFVPEGITLQATATSRTALE